MASQQKGPGGHYSGHNPIPTVRQFVENLDKDKKNRDAAIDQNATASKSPAKAPVTAQGGGVEDHKVKKKVVEGTEKTVTDPTTGRDVVIADVGPEMVDEVENPHVWKQPRDVCRRPANSSSSSFPMPTSTKTR
jgi:ABC-type Zn uptake system ZnuABC Zn-binding protein ZnuA